MRELRQGKNFKAVQAAAVNVIPKSLDFAMIFQAAGTNRNSLKGRKAYSTFIIGRQGAVNQQSEHLSNAQIEQYGKRASGAGPDTEAWVDQHLDDCSSCRSRVLDFQRTRFALLPDPKVNKASSSDCPSEDDLRNLAAGLSPDPKAAQLKTHAATCDRCGPLLHEYIE